VRVAVVLGEREVEDRRQRHLAGGEPGEALAHGGERLCGPHQLADLALVEHARAAVRGRRSRRLVAIFHAIS
jgi:hypothetical protein